MRGAYRKRRVEFPPNFKNFKPGGIPRKSLKSIVLTVDEYEAVRLADYQGMEHLSAAEEMAISRPTFTRLIDKARNKIARALVDGMELIVEGGNVEFTNTRHCCRDCGDTHIVPFVDTVEDCLGCGSENIEDIAQNYLGLNKKDNKKNKGDESE